MYSSLIGIHNVLLHEGSLFNLLYVLNSQIEQSNAYYAAPVCKDARTEQIYGLDFGRRWKLNYNSLYEVSH